MTVEEANALHAYLIDLQWKAYDAEHHAKPKPAIKVKGPSDRQ
jgi:hypothetical protein